MAVNPDISASEIMPAALSPFSQKYCSQWRRAIAVSVAVNAVLVGGLVWSLLDKPADVVTKPVEITVVSDSGTAGPKISTPQPKTVAPPPPLSAQAVEAIKNGVPVTEALQKDQPQNAVTAPTANANATSNASVASSSASTASASSDAVSGGSAEAAPTQVLTVTFDVAQDASFWVAGGLSGIREAQVALLWPWTVIGLLGAISLAKSVTLLSFGEEMAIGLGGHLQRTRILVGLTVLLLCGSAVAVAGPIGFVGLVTPHWARRLVGSDYRWIVPTSALLGALLLLLADLVARTVAAPFEIPLGAVTALVGVPFFLYLLNRKGGAMR